VSPQSPVGRFGYQWWYGGLDPARAGSKAVFKTARHALWAEGIYGQTIAVDPAEKLVMVQWSTWQEADMPASLYDEQALFFTAVARELTHAP
jgi:CubicO group peptidase (beta-lactamase class C family)